MDGIGSLLNYIMTATTSGMCKALIPNGATLASMRLKHLHLWHGLSMNVICPTRAEEVVNNMRQPTALEIVCFMIENPFVENMYEAYRERVLSHDMECPLVAHRRGGE